MHHFYNKINQFCFVKNMIKGRSKTEFEDDEVVPEFEEDFIAARKKCVGADCTLPPTQHLKMRVILISYRYCKTEGFYSNN